MKRVFRRILDVELRKAFGPHLLDDRAGTVLYFLRFLEEHLVDRHACVGTSRDELHDLVGRGLRVRCLPYELVRRIDSLVRRGENRGA